MESRVGYGSPRTGRRRKAAQLESQRKRRKILSGWTGQSEDVSQHQRTSALYIGDDVRYICCGSIYLYIFRSFSFSFPTFSFLSLTPNLSPLVSFIIVSFSLSSFFPLPSLVTFRLPTKKQRPGFYSNQSLARNPPLKKNKK